MLVCMVSLFNKAPERRCEEGEYAKPFLNIVMWKLSRNIVDSSVLHTALTQLHSRSLQGNSECFLLNVVKFIGNVCPIPKFA